VIDSVGQDAQPKFGWGEVVNAHATGLTTGTNSVISSNGQPMWIGSWGMAVRTAATGELATLQTTSGKIIARIGLETTNDWITHRYAWGWRVPNDDGIDLVISGGSPEIEVIVEAMRKQSHNLQT